jgi:hypothetical protein
VASGYSSCTYPGYGGSIGSREIVPGSAALTGGKPGRLENNRRLDGVIYASSWRGDYAGESAVENVDGSFFN